MTGAMGGYSIDQAFIGLALCIHLLAALLPTTIEEFRAIFVLDRSVQHVRLFDDVTAVPLMLCMLAVMGTEKIGNRVNYADDWLIVCFLTVPVTLVALIGLPPVTGPGVTRGDIVRNAITKPVLNATALALLLIGLMKAFGR